MRSVGPQNPYEVYCYRCHVTAPVGSRRCVHCGGRFSNQRALPQGMMTATPFDPAVEEDEEPPNSQQRAGSSLPMAAVWILLLIGGSIFRLCN